jgi:hypothetical protein
MTLLHQDPKAADPLYHKVQEMHPQFNPPTVFRDRVEHLYATCHDLVDKKFPNQIKDNFASRYSELYFGATFRKRLGLRVSHPSDKGPDYHFQDSDCWAEAVTVSNGERDNPNSIAPMECGVVTDYMKVREQIMLRITSSFTYKAQKLLDYIRKGIIRDAQRMIICISGGWLEGLYRFPRYPVGGFPEVVSALLPVGNMVLIINRDDRSITKRTFELRDSIAKKRHDSKPQAIRTDYFTDPTYAHVSAVVYSYANVTDSIDDSNLGRDFFVIHNPLANHALPSGSFKCGIEYEVKVDGDLISIETTDYDLP